MDGTRFDWKAPAPRPDMDLDGREGISGVCTHDAGLSTWYVYDERGRVISTESDPARAEARRLLAATE